jgi:hypothetical protein
VHAGVIAKGVIDLGAAGLVQGAEDVVTGLVELVAVVYETLARSIAVSRFAVSKLV